MRGAIRVPASIVVLLGELDFNLSAKKETIIQTLDGPVSISLINFDEG